MTRLRGKRASPPMLASKCCDQCLVGKRRIVSPERARQIIAGCIKDDTHFVCHKGTLAGLNVACAGVARVTGFRGVALRLAMALGVVQKIDPDSLKEPQS